MDVERRAMRCAEDIWPRLAVSAGLDAGGHALSSLSIRKERGDGARVVVLVKGAERYVLKFRLNRDKDKIETAEEAHRAAARSLMNVPDCAAPAVLASDTQTGALLLEWVSGSTLFQAFAENPDCIATGLAHAGRWMAHLHKGGARETVSFNGKWMLGRLDQMAADGVNAHDAFAACQTALGRVAKEAHGLEMQRAVIHGDLTTRNLMWDGQVMTGIDFENTGLHPIARDAAMLLCNVAVQCDGLPMCDAGGLLAPSLMEAFEQGLGQDAVPEPILRFFIGLQLLQRWVRLPKRRNTWSARHAYTFIKVSDDAARLLRVVP